MMPPQLVPPAPLSSSTAPYAKFAFTGTITKEHEDHLEHFGFVHFTGAVVPNEVRMITDEVSDIQARWLSEGRTKVRGVPLFIGKDDTGAPFISRMCFSSTFSPAISALVNDARFKCILPVVGKDARVGEQEQDGVVINRYLNVPGSAYPRLGWHTDGLRDLAFLRMPQRMLNVGVHLDDCPADNGGLRLIPKSHHQGFFKMCFRKKYFISHDEDPQEVAVQTQAGDLTLHDGRLWHRVAQSTRVGKASLRRSMYMPYLTGPFTHKTETSPTPIYHTLGMLLRRMKSTGARMLS